MIEYFTPAGAESMTGIPPETTLLDYIRDLRGDTGTKEGCASGDCGACTVVLVGSDDGENLHYRAINACITPAAAMHGHLLLTVEDLACGDQLDPAQQAMVDCHGSQCGFCTPGFVMSLFAHRQQHVVPDRAAIITSLGGNLCRCTGYRPIIDAGLAMYETPNSSDCLPDWPDLAAQLQQATDRPGELSQDGRRFLVPTDADNVARLLLETPDARLVAGATDLGLELTQGLATIETLIYLGRVRSLAKVRTTDNAIEIGAAATYQQVAPTLFEHWPALEELLHRLGSTQIRNQGTVGGNLGTASPIGDMPPVLLALNATLVLRRGEARRELPLTEFFLDYRRTALAPAEFIETIRIPRTGPSALFQVYKVSKRLEDDISAVCGAFCFEFDGDTLVEVRVAFGGMAAIPKRAIHCEAVLRGNPVTDDLIEQAVDALSEDFTPLDDLRASAHYRLTVAGNLLRRAFLSRDLPPQSLQVTHYE